MYVYMCVHIIVHITTQRACIHTHIWSDRFHTRKKTWNFCFTSKKTYIYTHAYIHTFSSKASTGTATSFDNLHFTHAHIYIHTHMHTTHKHTHTYTPSQQESRRALQPPWQLALNARTHTHTCIHTHLLNKSLDGHCNLLDNLHLTNNLLLDDFFDSDWNLCVCMYVCMYVCILHE